MALVVSADKKSAYGMLGGALDNLATVWTFTSEGLKTYDKYRRMPPSREIARAQALLKTYDKSLLKPSALSKVVAKVDTVKKCYEYARKVQDAFDETKRDGALFKLGVKISLDLAKKRLGASLTTHSCYAYHKAMLDALADALDAAHNSRAAVDAYRRAVSAATSKAVTSEFKRLEERKVAIVAAHVAIKDRVGVAADIARGLMEEKFAERKIQQYGGTDRIAEAIADLEAWRAMWARLSFESMKLLIMTGSELNVAIEAMARMRSLIAKLMGGSNTSVVAGRAAINAIEWEKYDRMVGEGMPDRAAMDPVEFAQSNRDKAMAWTVAFAEMCDFVRTEDVYFPSKFNAQLDRLNKVLYG